MTHLNKLTLALLTAFLAACGGGGGGNDGGSSAAPASTPATVTSSNYTTVGREATAATMSLVDLALNYNLVAGADVAVAPAWAAFGLAQWRALAPRFGQSVATVAGAQTTDNYSCNGGGTLTVVTNDTNGNDSPDAGESAVATFNNCVALGLTTTGTLTLRITAQPTGDLAGNIYTLGMTMVFDNLRVVTGAGTATAHGDLSLQSSRTALWVGQDVIATNRFSSAVIVGSATRTRTISDYSGTVNFASTQSTTRFSGTVASSELGNQSVTVRSTVDILRLFSESYPRSGAAECVGANGSRATLTAVDATTVTLALDANGDGTPEQSTNVLWSSLI